MADETKVDKVANSVLLLLTSRLMATFGVPIAGFIAWQLWGFVMEVRQELRATDKSMSVWTERIAGNERRIQGLEEQTRYLERRLIERRDQ